MVLDQDLIELLLLRTGLPEGEAKKERGTMFQLRMFARILEEGSFVEADNRPRTRETQPSPKVDLRKMMIPLGPIAVFGASNFPLAYSSAGGDTASALAADAR